MVVGTRGDIVPLALLAAELAQRGHKVRVATHSVYGCAILEIEIDNS
jgi:UDP:flavonoid glycosyltransferase YjiC (YdhE family)